MKLDYDLSIKKYKCPNCGFEFKAESFYQCPNCGVRVYGQTGNKKTLR